MAEITYSLENDLSAGEFRDILVRSTLGERRPIDEPDRLEKMLRQADIIVVARCEEKAVGVARAITDFCYCCYLSDLAVDVAYQKRGIGKRLIQEVREHAGDVASLVLIAAPAAEHYYARVGMQALERGWIIPRAK